MTLQGDKENLCSMMPYRLNRAEQMQSEFISDIIKIWDKKVVTVSVRCC